MINKYPYTDFNEYNLDWVITHMKDVIKEWASTKTEWSDMQTEFADLKNFVTTYFDNLDVQEEINNKLDEMAEDGTLSDLLIPIVGPALDIFIPGDYERQLVNNANGNRTKVFYRYIPKEYQPAVAYAPDNETEYGVKMTNESGATCSVNASRWVTATGDFYGYFRANGVTIHENDLDSSSNSRDILYFKNGRLGAITVTEPTANLDDNNYDWALVGFEMIIDNGTPTPRADPSDYSTSDLHPRSFIAQLSNDDYIIGSTEGRSPRTKGFSLSDIVRFLQSLGHTIRFAYSLDGGGSVTLTEKGYRVNDYINNENRKIKSVIYFKKDSGYYNDLLKSAVSDIEPMYFATRNDQPIEGQLFAYNDSSTKQAEFFSLDTRQSQAFMRFAPNRVFFGVDHDFSLDGNPFLLMNVTRSAFQWNDITRFLAKATNSEVDYTDTIPSVGSTGIFCVEITSSSVATSLGLAAQDYGRSILITFRTNANFSILLTRANVYYRYDTGSWRKVTLS